MPGRNSSGRGPCVSIGLPPRNGIPTIGPAIESLLIQDFSDFELFISDNSSDDDPADVCASFACLDSRMRFERLARNIGAMRNFERVMQPACEAELPALRASELAARLEIQPELQLSSSQIHLGFDHFPSTSQTQRLAEKNIGIHSRESVLPIWRAPCLGRRPLMLPGLSQLEDIPDRGGA